MKGHVEWARGDPPAVVRLSQAAQRDPAAHPGQHAISAMQEARALAVLGDAVAVDRKLIDADRAEDQAREHEQDRPPWLYYHSPGFFDVQRGRAWLHLGVHDPARNRRAVDALADGIAQLDEIARGSEWGASYLLYLARAYMQAGDAEQACVVAIDGRPTRGACRLSRCSPRCGGCTASWRSGGPGIPVWRRSARRYADRHVCQRVRCPAGPRPGGASS